MDWIKCLKKSIKYIEDHILEDFEMSDLVKEVYISPYYLQKGFLFITGYNISEYIKCRRLYLAGLDICKNENKIIDIAYKYGYKTPESFTKAFTRFHGITPKEVKRNPGKLKTFLPLKVIIKIEGGEEMNYVVEEMQSFKVIGFKKKFKNSNGYQEIPKFWDEVAEKHFSRVCNGLKAQNDIEEAVVKNNIGELGVCIDDNTMNGEFSYLIAGFYKGGDVPDGLEVVEFPNLQWIKFESIGPLPFALQNLNTKIYKEWLPNNDTYDIDGGYNIEWYSMGNSNSSTYVSGIWLPIKKK